MELELCQNSDSSVSSINITEQLQVSASASASAPLPPGSQILLPFIEGFFCSMGVATV